MKRWLQATRRGGGGAGVVFIGRGAGGRGHWPIRAAVRGGTTARVSGDTAPAAAPRITEHNLGAAIAGEARTESYARIYKTSSVGSQVEPFAEEVQRRFARATANLKGERLVGVVVAYGGGGGRGGSFASPAPFCRYWVETLFSQAVGGIGRPPSQKPAPLAE